MVEVQEPRRWCWEPRPGASWVKLLSPHSLISLRSVNTFYLHLSIVFHVLGMSRETRISLLGGGDGLSVPPKLVSALYWPCPILSSLIYSL